MTAFTATDATRALVQGFETAFNRHDVDALMAAMTSDCVVEIVAPPERSGGRWEGQATVGAVWTGLAEALPGYAVETEEVFASGDRFACRWTPRWDRPGGGRGRIRGIDAYTVRDGKIGRTYAYFAH
jgi:ketosteroid isomerase-like protein